MGLWLGAGIATAARNHAMREAIEAWRKFRDGASFTYLFTLPEALA
jgi:hypothetical protein